MLVPHLSYKNLAIQEGNSASLAWYRMFDPTVTREERATTERNLRAYCELDTRAMVEIYRYLAALLGISIIAKNGARCCARGLSSSAASSSGRVLLQLVFPL